MSGNSDADAVRALADGGLGLPVYHEFIGKHGEWLRLSATGRIVDKIRLPHEVRTLQPAVVAIDGAGLWRGIHKQLKAFFLRFLAQNGSDVLKQGRNMHRHVLQHEFSGFYF